MTDRPAGATPLAERTRQLLALHVDALRTGNPLLLPNAWDVVSATDVAAAGFAAVATSSRAIAQGFGERDDDSSDPDLVFDFLARITRAVDVPVTADLQAGLGLSPVELADRMVDAGLAGCNLEDGNHHVDGPHGSDPLVATDVRAAYLSDLRDATERHGVHPVLNARIDSFIRGVGDSDEERADDVLQRGRAYLAAGADCVYPMGHIDLTTSRRLVTAFDAPVNLMSRAGGPTIAELTSIGTARISFGSGVHSLVMDRQRVVLQVLASGGELPAV